ncbi:catalase-like domain-containing protein [Lasiosphaeria hispida]|uniref:Catalase-like domain-containing protein n=1 Tax=Lasiosphaeria hispida TaxID=260671 RepID=A0AAJ0H5Y1_9PEZI|nr:catalase-like domain-containing protein [Lasiosphaeria hispida]
MNTRLCRDPIQGPDVIRSQQRNPKNFLLDYDLFDLLANTPEANHGNSQGKFAYIKCHFLARHGQKQFTDEEADQVCGEDPDYSKRNLWDAIERGENLEWIAHVQVMQPEQADPDTLGFSPFDATKVWPWD